MTTNDSEQRAKARRIAENAGEETESKKREKLQWMYTQKENNEEDYLLGVLPEFWNTKSSLLHFRCSAHYNSSY